MTQHEIQMYEELLVLLEKRFDDGEIDKSNYVELKTRYTQKLEAAKQNQDVQRETANIYTSVVISDTQSSMTEEGKTRIEGGTVLKDIRIAGSGKIDSDVECNNLKSAGSLKSYGNIIAHGNVGCAGSFKCEGSIHVDGDATFSGSAKIEHQVIVQGRISAAGSFTSGDQTQAERGIKFSGSSKIYGSLLSQGLVDIAGRVQVEGDLVGEDVLINKGRHAFGHKWKKLKPSIIEGNVFGTGEIFLGNTRVDGDVKGLRVEVGPYSKVEGTIYYVESIEVSNSSKIENEPVKIRREDLKL